jgi:hypothetical protein
MPNKILLVILSLVLCSSVVLAKPSYQRVLNQWTEKGSNYELDNLEARLIWKVTYKALPLRLRQLEERASFTRFTDKEKKKLEGAERKESAKYDDFFASIYAGSNTSYVVGKDVSLWKFTLELPDGTEVNASSVDKVKVTELVTYFYPYVTKWAKTYRIRFPKTITGNVKNFSLHMSGVPAGNTLKWKLK